MTDTTPAPNTPQNNSPAPSTTTPPRFLNLRILRVLLPTVLIVLIIVILSIFFASKPSKPKPPTTAPTNVLAYVGKTPITKDGVDREIALTWGVYSRTESQKESVRKKSEDQLIEKELIRQEAQKQGIVISSQEIEKRQQEEIKQLGGIQKYQALLSNNNWTDQDQKQKIIDAILREKAENAVVAYRLADMANAFRNPQDPAYQIKKEAILKTLDKIREFLILGKSVSESSVLVAQMPGYDLSFQTILSKKVKRTDGLAKTYINAIFNAHKNQVTNVTESGGGSFMVAKIIDENNIPYDTFSDWLSKIKAQNVRYVK